MLKKKKSHRIEPESALFPHTFISTVSRLTIKVVNDEDSIFRYEWRKYSSEAEEQDAINNLDLSDPSQRNRLSTVLLYDSDIFSIDTQITEVWPERSQQVVISFSPNIPGMCEETVYLYNLDTKERIPYVFRGEALHPQMAFNVEQINMGHVCLDDNYEYCIKLANTGQVNLDFKMIPRELLLRRYVFTPTEGHLPIGGSIPITIKFYADHVGQFNEVFEYEIKGYESQRASIILFGRVVGPSFQLSVDRLEYENVSFGFLYCKEFEIENISDIQFDFSLHMIQDQSFDSREFAITPNVGTVAKRGKQKIRVEFIPITIQNYNLKLYLESSKFSERLATIPITATCICPDVTIGNSEIDLQSSFIGYKYTTMLKLQDDTDFPAKFEFIEATDESTLDATVTVGKYRGTIGSHRVSELPVYITPLQLGHLKLQRYIRIYGSEKPPLPFTISCLCTGPNIVLDPPEVIDFGAINILTDITTILSVFNNSLIEAPYKAVVESDTGVFSAEPLSGILQPGEKLPMKIIAHLDDTIMFKGKIILTFKYLQAITLEIVAKGMGTAIVSSMEMQHIDLGYVFTGQPTFRKFTLENKGRRKQELKWTEQKAKVEGKAAVSYIISPDSKVLEPHEIIDCYMRFESTSPCSFTITPTCTATIAKARTELYKPLIKGIFIKPALKFDNDHMIFKYIHDTEKEEEISGHLSGKKVISPSQSLLLPITQENTVTNHSELPLIFDAICPQPFSISQTHYELQPQESASFSVTFNTKVKRDFTSQTQDIKIKFVFKKNPQVYNLNVRGIWVFPNISFSQTEINYGALLRHTEETKIVHLTNPSELPAYFVWELLPNSKGEPISNIFDVYPIRDLILPKESKDMHFTFFAADGAKDSTEEFSGKAVCHVIGGPDYTIELIGSSSNVEYKIVPSIIDFGFHHYLDVLISTITMTNTSDVTYKFKVKIPHSCSFNQISVEPSAGTLQAGCYQVFTLRVCPGLPKEFNETIFIQNGSFDDAEIHVKVSSCFPQLLINIPRDAKDPLLELAGEKPNPDFNSLEYQYMNNKLQDLLRSNMYVKNSALKKVDITSIRKFTGFVTSRFFVDFGPITLGEVADQTFIFKNITIYPIGFEILTTNLEGTGFSIEPTSFQGIPNDKELEIAIKFDTTMRNILSTGEEFFEVPVILTANQGYVIRIRAEISMPVLNFSHTHFDFETILVGQQRIMHVQVLNMNTVPVEFKINDAQNFNVLQRNNDRNKVFFATPTNGILPPSSFQTIAITFAPSSDRTYSMQFPIDIKYNTQQVQIFVKGVGVHMKVGFDPNVHQFPPIQPFDVPAQAEIELFNPCQYPIEVYSPMFDFKILTDQLRKKYEALNPPPAPEEEQQQQLIVSFSNYNMKSFSRFSICVIINGPLKSGRTTVSKIVSKHLGDIPIINLKNLWTGLEDPTDDQFIQLLNDAVSSPDCLRGFVIDGLDYFQEPPQTEQNVNHLLKAKGVVEEVTKNPFAHVGANVKELTSIERAFAYILGALDGHYIFQVAIQAKEDVLYEHEASAKKDLELEKEVEKQDALKLLFQMDETDYENLSPEEQEEFNEKRIEHRRKLMETLMPSEENPKALKLNRSNADFKASPARNRNPRKSLRRGLPNDPYLQSITIFQLTLGKIANALESGGSCFHVIDPASILDPFEESTALHHNNSILIDGSMPITQIESEITHFIPTLQILRDKGLSKLIPDQKTIIPQYSKEFMPAPKQFTIVNDGPPGEFPSFSKEQQAPAKQSFHSTRGRKSARIAEPTVIDGIDIMNYTKRWILEPSERTTIKVQFDSDVVGDFDQNLSFRINECRDDSYNLNLKGTCAYPDIVREPKMIFPRIAQRLKLKTEFAYVTELNQFHVGAVLIGKERNNRSSPYLYKHTIKLTNNSLFTAEVFVTLSEQVKAWNVDPQNLTINPGEDKPLTILFHPTVPDTYKNWLKIFVRDNPDPVSFEIVAFACSPQVEVTNTLIDFEKLLLRQTRTIDVPLKNSGKIPAYWRIKAPNQYQGLFTFDATEGIIHARSNGNIQISYSSIKQQAIKKPLQIDILDTNKQKIYMSHHLNLIAESFDVNFDLVYPKGMDHLNFGTLKVFQSKTINCVLKNKGKYPSIFKFGFTNKNLKNVFKITPMEATISPGEKGIQLTFFFSSDSVKHYTRSSGISLTVIDSITHTQIISLPIRFTVDSVFSIYELNPSDAIVFGALPVAKQTTKEWIISNKGAFPFEFELTPRIEAVEPPQNGRGRSRGRGHARPKKPTIRPSPQARKSNKRGSANALTVGQFYVSMSSGTVPPNQSATLFVEFVSSVPSKYDNAVILKISDCSPDDQATHGIEIPLSAETFIPGLQTNDMEPIFPGQNLCLRYDILKSETAAFLEDEQLYHFAPNILNNKAIVKIALKNPFPVPCNVDINVKPKVGKTKGEKTLPFDLDIHQAEIPPKSIQNVELSFTPIVSGKFSGVFEASVRGGTDASTKLLKFGVEGVGTLPTIAPEGLKIKQGVIKPISFGHTLINYRKQKLIPIKNDGLIPARLTVVANSSPDFILENFDFIQEFQLDPGRLFHLAVAFYPQAIRKSQFEIQVNVLDNPKSDLLLTFTGEGFSEDIIFEGIPGDENLLVFKDNVVGRQQTLTFTMRNVCSSDIRFIWPTMPEYKFSPHIGHLRHGKWKQIAVTFFTDQPLKSGVVKAACQWSKMELTDPQSPDWDDSMKTVKFVKKSSLVPKVEIPPFPPDEKHPRGSGRKFPGRRPSPPPTPRRGGRNKLSATSSIPAPEAPVIKPQDDVLVKVIEIKPEPPYELIPGKYQDLKLKMSAISDFIKYQINKTEVSFSPTMMFETRSAEVKITNISNIRFEYQWRTTQLTSLRTNYAQTKGSPFTVSPATGYIEAGQVTMFNINFTPEEVDDFTAVMRCEIPFLQQMDPPEIYVTGFSRRPLCHFNVEMSDYLSAGRRHPDCVYALPDDIRVIELFSTGIGKRSVKKFEIINATADAYEVFWTNDPEHRTDVIQCETSRALISSGKRYMACFSYLPKSVRTVESVWTFTIPEHKVTVNFLVVGRIMPQ